MISFFKQIGLFISTVVDWVVSAIKSLVDAVAAIPHYLSILFSAVSALPPVIVSFSVAAIAVLLVWFLLGRT